MLRLVRDAFTNYDTTGVLYGNSGRPIAFTLEDPIVARPGSKPCIPYGEYPVVLAMSSRYNRIMPRLEHVPGRSGILIHTGNTEKDTTGCILVGTQRKNVKNVAQYLIDSRKAFELVYAEIAQSLSLGSLRISIEKAS